MAVNIKCTKRDNARNQNFPGCMPELPVLFDPHTNGDNNEPKEEDTMHGS